MFVWNKVLNRRHMTTVFFLRGAERKRCRLGEEEAREGSKIVFTADGIPLSQVTSFKYLGRIHTVVDDDYPTVVINLQKSRHNWERLMRVMGREGVDAHNSVHIYLVVVQSVIIFGSETWVMTPRIVRLLGGFRHRVARRLTVRQPWQGRVGLWSYLPLEDTMAGALLQEVDTYVSFRQNTGVQFIATRPIVDLCLAAEQIRVTQVSRRWWEQDGVGVEGMRTAAWGA